MSEPWTPGPWLVGFDDGSGADEDSGCWITNPALMESDGLGFVVVKGGKGPDGEQEGVCREADARLIAAAPEMAEWIAEMVAEAEAHVAKLEAVVGPINLPDTQLEQGRALLSRVRGEA